ncbi:hypothetical protein LZ24_00179 [Desulfobotulus alkaliphilus]|uniref:Uncharacterized protein n=1 Tax=Desulfobotulus alkaliphilus TaxID=622671 RepID=A0A562S9Y2_9BACT|nr:hypothetical protein [Desulfobotulus alkaliphilus]TWI77370.1 hypothetical protein LZ24_00179 [Desulfobotulus alkaliphilus]
MKKTFLRRTLKEAHDSENLAYLHFFADGQEAPWVLVAMDKSGDTLMQREFESLDCLMRHVVAEIGYCPAFRSETMQTQSEKIEAILGEFGAQAFRARLFFKGLAERIGEGRELEAVTLGELLEAVRMQVAHHEQMARL